MSPEDLHRALSNLPPSPSDPAVLVGHDTLDDAGVYLVAPDIALIQTVDFFTPVVDDPGDFGRIAATNALSDVYAMGGEPKTALNLVCWPPSGLDPEVLGEILAGGAEKVHEAGCTVIGGHSVQDEELKYGLAVTGVAHPDRLLTNAGARPGDRLVLTKPLGTGVLTTALKHGAKTADQIESAITSMKTLNGAAMRAALEADAHAATDITGFGLVGHGVQFATASGVTLEIDVRCLPLFDDVGAMIAAGHVPAGGSNNRAYFGTRVRAAAGIDAVRETIAYDPQTSGGLLLSVAAEVADDLVRALIGGPAPDAAVIGTVRPPEAEALVLGDGT